MEEKKWKVYIHTNKVNNKKYIGITSRDVYKRWGKNGYCYKPRCSTTTRFWSAIQCYGWDRFNHEILYENLTEKEAKDKEIELIDQYNTMNKKYGYNMTEGGDGTCGIEVSDETRKRLSDACIGKKNGFYGRKHTKSSKELIGKSSKGRESYWKTHPITQEAIDKITETKSKKSKIVAQYTLEGNFIKSFKNVKDAEIITGLPKTSIYCSCSKLRECHGYYFRYYDEEEEIKDIIKPREKQWGFHCRKEVMQFNTYNEYITTYESVTYASKVNGIKDSGISSCCNGKQKTAGGYIWRYAE